MSLSHNLNAYPDVRKVFDAALAQGGVRYRCETAKAAVHWRHRAHRFRKLLYEQAQEAALIPGSTVSTPYDELHISVSENVVTVTPIRLEGQIEDLEGNEVVVEDELLEEAKAFKRKLTGDDNE